MQSEVLEDSTITTKKSSVLYKITSGSNEGCIGAYDAGDLFMIVLHTPETEKSVCVGDILDIPEYEDISIFTGTLKLTQ